ncbi:MAG: hypothetical protein IJ782_06915 [Prevotella sp.]|nr:hypothetical protein [Prevotella sp.]
MATTTLRQHTTRPMSYKPIHTTKVFDMPNEEEFLDMDKELYTPEEAFELTMKDIKAIYDRKDAV